MQDSGLRDLISALNHLPNVALGLGPGAKVHTVFSSESGEYPVSIFIKLFIKRFFLNISAGAQRFFHSYLWVTTCSVTTCYRLKSTRSSGEAANTRDLNRTQGLLH